MFEQWIDPLTQAYIMLFGALIVLALLEYDMLCKLRDWIKEKLHV